MNPLPDAGHFDVVKDRRQRLARRKSLLDNPPNVPARRSRKPNQDEVLASCYAAALMGRVIFSSGIAAAPSVWTSTWPLSAIVSFNGPSTSM